MNFFKRKKTAPQKIYYQEECPIDKYPDLAGWCHWTEGSSDPEPFPGYKEALEAHLENCNYHDWVNLPATLEMIVDCTPLTQEEKAKLYKRLCNAIYNLDILEGVY